MPRGIYPGNERKRFCQRGHDTFIRGRNYGNCRECQAIWRKNNARRSAELSLAAHYRRREIINREKMRPCADCKIQYPPYVMDFDHLDPLQKTDNVASIERHRLAKVKAEIAKCEVVCSNCHRIRTHNRGHRPDLQKISKETQNA